MRLFATIGKLIGALLVLGFFMSVSIIDARSQTSLFDRTLQNLQPTRARIALAADSSVVSRRVVIVAFRPANAAQALAVKPVAAIKPPVPAKPTPVIQYRVKPGDTLSLIAQKYGLKSWRLLAEANAASVTDPNLIQVGQVLKVTGGRLSTGVAKTAQSTKRAAPIAIRQARKSSSVELKNVTSIDGLKNFARSLFAAKGWSVSEQGACMDSLWTKESGWRYNADNPSSDAFGIPQSLPGSKMASAGADWATNPQTQIRWGLGYIADRYGSPCGAWNHSVATNWY